MGLPSGLSGAFLTQRRRRRSLPIHRPYKQRLRAMRMILFTSAFMSKRIRHPRDNRIRPQWAILRACSSAYDVSAPLSHRRQPTTDSGLGSRGACRPCNRLRSDQFAWSTAGLRQEGLGMFKRDKNWVELVSISALYVTHDQVEATAGADRGILLRGGEVEQEGSPQSVYEAPNSALVADFMGSNNHLSGRLVSVDGDFGTIEVAGGRLIVLMMGRSSVGDRTQER